MFCPHRMARARSLVLLLTAVLTACTSWQPVHFATLPSADEVQGAPGVVLTERTEFHFHANGMSGAAVLDTRYEQDVRIFRPAAQNLIARSQFYDENFTRVQSMAARLVEPGGIVRGFQMGNAEDSPTFSGGVLFQSARVLSFHLSDVPTGSVWQYRSEVRGVRPRLVPLRHAFGGLMPKQQDEVVVRLPLDWQVDCVVRQGDKVLPWVPTETVENDDRVLT